MKGQLINIKLNDTNVIKAEYQYEIPIEQALNFKSIIVIDYYTNKTIYIPTHSIMYITEDDTKRIGF
ncbi:hypothetical protein YTCETSXE_CDS0056 [Staphylococcus phage MVC_VPHSA2]|uniref:Uncharacterized protein n=1 Tax=Staphylococcus phage MVC_VPHSA1 TaxID=3088876 RepID=A0ABZ0QYP9_9CAUD|nr:hypothetical protein FBHYGVHD_CDS0079 [Staphylococcus phage MVC_VPHSA1]WPF65012.1 hypothetical protein YTCETSXE_CDS0056 [Staphylococcus phage MVC_VPHSA2]